MFQFRKVSENRLLLGRPQSIERLGLAALLTGLALIGAPLTGEFGSVYPYLLMAGFGLLALGLRFCFLYERISITRSEHDLVVEGYWSRRAFRISRRELLGVRLYYRNMFGQKWRRYELQLCCRQKKTAIVYASCAELFTMDDAFAVARFLGTRFMEDSDFARLARIVGHFWRSLWSNEPLPAKRARRWHRRGPRAQRPDSGRDPVPHALPPTEPKMPTI